MPNLLPVPPTWIAPTVIRRLSRAVAVAMIGVLHPSHAGAQTPPTLTLTALLDSVARHPTVAAAQARVQAARGSRVTSGAFGNPVFAYQVDNTPFPGGPQVRGVDREGMTTLMLPLEPLYQRGARVRMADARVRAATDDALAARQHVALEASRAYYRAALAQVGVATSRDLSAWLDSVLAYNRSRVDEGVTAEADLIRSQLERDRAAVDATMQDVDLAQARAALAAFLGDPRTVDVRLLTVAVDELPMTLPRGGVTDRAELRAARERLTAADAGASVERGMILRQLGATFGTKQMAGTTSMIAGVSFPIPIFDPNRGEIARAGAERDAAAYDLAAVERETAAEIVGASNAATLLTTRATALAGGGQPGLLARADDARRIALGAYREGAVPLLQVLDAARAWADARLAYYRLIYAQRESVLVLLVARGDDLLNSLPSR
jgi:cobalt-zinc-cadmium efflux system outer membrane protein